MKKTAAIAAAFATLTLGVAAVATAEPPIKSDPNGIVDFAPGFQYTVLATAGETQVVSTESGDTFPMPGDFDANVAVPGPNGTTWLLSAHELTKPVEGDYQGDAGKPAVPEQATTDDGDSDGWGSVSRLTLDKAGKVTKAELITTGLHNLCAGALTPWGTFLVNEEFPFRNDPQKRSGWVWEIDPASGEATQLTGMGRFSHEQEALVDGAWYLTDDLGGWRFDYKFVPDSASDLTSGDLYGLRFDRSTMTGTWVGPLDPMDPHADMVSRGIDPTLYGFDKAERMVATPDGHGVVFSESGSTSAPNTGDNPGNVWRLTPQADGSVRGSVLVVGDFDTVSHPDNVRFTPAGDLVIAEDNGSHQSSANGGVNELRLLPAGTTGGGSTIVLAKMRGGGEPTGPWFAHDGKTMYLSVQDVDDQSHVLAVKWPRPFTKSYGHYRGA